MAFWDSTQGDEHITHGRLFFTGEEAVLVFGSSRWYLRLNSSWVVLQAPRYS